MAGTLDLTISFGRNVGSLISFSVILWTVSGSWTVPGTSVEIHGYMFWAALVYAIAGTWLTHLVGRPLVRLNFTQQLFEANFRFGLVRVRENPEGIAPDHGGGRAAAARQPVPECAAELRGERREKPTSLTASCHQATTLLPASLRRATSP